MPFNSAPAIHDARQLRVLESPLTRQFQCEIDRRRALSARQPESALLEIVAAAV
jgi:hypothetical protein